MSYYTDDAVKAKLSSLNEAQDTIVTVAQWLLFHKRHATRTAELWMAKVKESPPTKRLSLIYLANEVAQQSKARKKEDFVNAFAPLIAEGTSFAYRSSPMDIQQKVRRVVEVWRQRNIFDEKTQVDVESKLDEIDRARVTSNRPGLGGSLFGSASPSVATELQPIVTAQTTLSAASAKSSTAFTTFTSSHDAVRNNASAALPIRAAQLGSLLQSLTDVESSVAESIKARRALLVALEKVINDTRKALATEEDQVKQLAEKRSTLTNEKAQLEDMIVRGISSGAADTFEPPRPDTEPLTPPAIESLTPVGSPRPDGGLNYGGGGVKHANNENGYPEPVAKKRRLNASDEFAAFADGDALGAIDPDVVALLARE